MRRLARILLETAASTMVLAASLAFAQAPPTDKTYYPITPPEQVTDTKKVEVVEVFSYGCIHCAHFQPQIDAWRTRLDKNKTEFVYLPATFNPLFEALARAYYAAESMGVLAKTHQAVFDAIHEKGFAIRSFNDIVNLYAQLGVNRDEFKKASESFLVETKLRRAKELIVQYRIDGTPSLVIAGKYRVTTDLAGNQENMIKIADQLIAKELAQSQGTSRQAPSKGK